MANQALKTEFVRLKCHGSFPDPSYSQELSSPSHTIEGSENQINQTAHMVAKAVYQKGIRLHLPQWTGSISLGYERGGHILLTKAFLSFTHLKGLETKLTRLYMSTWWPRLFILKQIGICLYFP